MLTNRVWYLENDFEILIQKNVLDKRQRRFTCLEINLCTFFVIFFVNSGYGTTAAFDLLNKNVHMQLKRCIGWCSQLSGRRISLATFFDDQTYTHTSAGRLGKI